MEVSSKRTTVACRGVDRISSLTDDILLHILSFLPTKFAAGTAVLSTRWKNLADKLVDIDLDDCSFLRRRLWVPEKESPETLAHFSVFVRRVLFSRLGSSINRFRLKCGNRYDYHLFDVWIQFVLLHNVRELVLHVKIDESESFPAEIFTSKTLEVLKLRSAIELIVPANINLRNLRVLRLESIEFNGDESIKRMFSGCPVLQELFLFFCEMLDVNNLEVCSLSLKKLSLLGCYGDHRVSLDTPNLENLLYYTRGDAGFSIKNPNSIVHAEIGWGLINKKHLEEVKENEELMSYGRRGTDCINSMSNVRSLCLEGPSLTALYYSQSSLATFGNLTHLELGASRVVRDWWSLADLLAFCPNLEALIFYEGFIAAVPDVGKEFAYRLPETIPVCFAYSLKMIKIGVLHGNECEFRIIEYFLNNVASLRKMIIGSDVCKVSPFGSTKKRGLEFHEEMPEWVLLTCKRLSEAPRCSKTCQISVSWVELCKKSMRIFI